jgi:preprotein translocase subunit SecA
MLDRVKFDTASVLARIEIRTETDLQREEQERQQRLLQALQLQHAEAPSILTSGVEGSSPDPRAAAAAGAAAGGMITPESAGRMLGSADTADAGQAGTFIRGDRKVGRNEPCPCGSGKKFKQCHGQLQQE